MGAWWPVIPFSAGEDQVRDVTVERHVGGRIYERRADGTEHAWGGLLVYQPPERFAMTWRVLSVPTKVDLTFTGLGPALTKVSLVHSGWEKLSGDQLAADCALPGGYLGGAFDQGWAIILGKFAEAAEEAG
jgi:uncharacterized protein YndB with AHSA1/START domain